MKNEEQKSDNLASESSNFERVIPTKEDRIRDRKEDLERNHNAKLINYDILKESLPDFAEWLESVCRYGNVDSVCLIFLEEVIVGREKEDRYYYKIYFYTSDNQYSISIYPPIDEYQGYCGCTVSSRKSRPGEFWNRGNDLPDGEYTSETFDRIARRIIQYEMKAIKIFD